MFVYVSIYATAEWEKPETFNKAPSLHVRRFVFYLKYQLILALTSVTLVLSTSFVI